MTEEHAVIVAFHYGSTDLQPLFALEDRLQAVVESVGEYDGNEVAVDGSEGTLYFYGPDGDRLFEVVRPVLEATAFMRGATATIRYGPPGRNVKEKQVVLAG